MAEDNIFDLTCVLGTHNLSRGAKLENDIIYGRSYGNPNGPIIVVMGGISATRFIADAQVATPRNKGQGWWSRLVHKSGAIDLNRFRVIGMDFAPNLNTQNIPEAITTQDQARRLKALLHAQGIDKIAAIIGSSYGGMTALAFAQDYPDAVDNLCIIGAAHRPYPIGVAWRGIQRRVVRLGLAAGQPEAGLKLARELAMTTYRTAEEFADRFTLEETGQSPTRFDICDYLGSRGDAFAQNMDAQRFLALSESIDLHRAEPEAITTPTLLMSAISDQLAPLPDMRELRDRLGGPSTLFTFTSLYGHDAFLKEYDAMAPRIAEFCNQLSL